MSNEPSHDNPCVRLTVDELRRFELFKDDDDNALAWLAGRFEVVCFEPGEIVIHEGSPADRFIYVLEGELQFFRPGDLSLGVYIVHPGEPTGVLPFSRMKTFLGRSRAIKRTRAAVMPASHLRELVYRAPNLAQKLVSQMTDRTREFTQMSERNSKMLALGKLSAGLAHELNNPASAVVRSSTKLRELLVKRRQDALSLRSQLFPENVQKTLAELTRITTEAAQTAHVMDDLERSDLEAELADWLDEQGISSEHSSGMVAAGITQQALQPLTETYDSHTLDLMLNLLLGDYQMLALISEIEEASRRMSELLLAVKSYSYMDTSPVVEVDVEEGLHTTLRMFQHQLKQGFTVRKDFAANLPKIRANGNELNQIWTNLIDNAIDAMDGLDPGNRVLTVKTDQDIGFVIVEISDSGKGIPPDVQGRIFEPFFTTKSVGKGTGLGLDIVQRIVRNHHGAIHLESKPGCTTFQIRLPVAAD